MSSPRPVILCGQTEAIGKGVIANLKPEYEVIHMILSPSTGIREIPHLLSSNHAPPSTGASNIGSQNYSASAIAIILGGAYTDTDIEAMRDACKGEGVAKVPWLRPDLEKPAPPLGPAYGVALVERIKVLFRELRDRGKMEGDGVYFY